ncbi:histone-lysine N-methyltransferase SETMAR [Trichonephila clavipes]|nr:histone-lysine N-methyltransferase SETMAR [Trichonephila clavipes]
MTASWTAAFIESSLIVFKTFKNKELWRSNFAGGGGKFMSPQNIRAAAPPFPIALIPYVNLRDLSLQESDRSERPSKTNNDVLRSLLENNPHLTCQEIAEEFGIHHTTVGDHIKSLAFVVKRNV